MNEQKILVVEDEADIRELIDFNLTRAGYKVITAGDGEEGLQKAKVEKPSAVLLDIMMPKMSGINVCEELRRNQDTKTTPIIMLTAKGEEEDIVRGLEVGADDYITKPFSPKVLVARLKAVGRRNASSEVKNDQTIEMHGLTIDPVKRRFFINQEEVELTFSEFQILHLMAKKAGWVFTRSQIVDTIRGQNHAITDRSVDVQIVGLRRKLGELGNVIETVRGVGYRFKEPDSGIQQ